MRYKLHSRYSDNSVIWNSKKVGSVDKIEKVQRRFLHYIAFKLHMGGQPISPVEISYDLIPLSTRRDCNDILFL